MNPIYQSERFSISANHVQWLDQEASIISSQEIHSTYKGSDEIPFDTEKNCYVWKLKKDISHYPQYQSGIPLLDAVYNLALEELEKNKTDDKKRWDTGAKWSGVWTRDIGYSIILSLALLDPATSMNCLRAKTKDGKIIQDTGTGGSWPVSSDRVTWITAAWELYLVTGSLSWLKEIFPLIQSALEADEKTIYYPDSPALGESSFLDWREQSYPRWMKPVDIYRSESLGTNCGHYQANIIATKAAGILGLPAEKYIDKARDLKKQINEKLWIEEKGYYGQYRYGRHYLSLSPRSEALGEALSIIYHIADTDRQKIIMQNTPLGEYGIPSISPQIPGIPSYHNDGIWPFVQGFWNLAAAQSGNMNALEHGLASLCRAAALFLTHKENFTAHSGDAQGTEINSDRQLWSVAAALSMVYKVFAGIHPENDRIIFRPMIPEGYKSHHSIKNFQYRDMTLDITITGWGNRIKSFYLDGKSHENCLPADKKGNHLVEIELENTPPQESRINIGKIQFSPDSPKITRKTNVLQWDHVAPAVEYAIYDNGSLIKRQQENSFTLPAAQGYHEYQVKSMDEHGVESFLSEPVVINSSPRITVSAGLFHTSSGESDENVLLTKKQNTRIEIPVVIEQEGNYLAGFTYANGSAVMWGSNSCALRTLFLETKEIGTFVFPVVGENEWDEWRPSNHRRVKLPKGEHRFVLEFKPWNENMNGDINDLKIREFILEKL